MLFSRFKFPKSSARLVILASVMFFYSRDLNAGLNVSIQHQVMYSNQGKPYIESWLLVEGNSLQFKQDAENRWKASVQCAIIAHGSNGVLNYSKFNLGQEFQEGSEKNSSSNQIQDLFYIERLEIDTGTVVLEYMVLDVGAETIDTLKYLDTLYIESLTAPLSSKPFFISTISTSIQNAMLLRGKYQIMPILGNASIENESPELKVYQECYFPIENLDSGMVFYQTIWVENANDSSVVPGFALRKRIENLRRVVPGIQTLNLKELSSGHYWLTTQLSDKNGKVYGSSKSYFFRDNPEQPIDLQSVHQTDYRGSFLEPIQNLDTLKTMLGFLRPLSSGEEIQFATNAAATEDLHLIKQFIWSFWFRKYPKHPAEEWSKYVALLKAIDKEFGTAAMRGYETDRGRIWLKYGPPNSRNKQYNEPSAYPYEIWQYYQIKAQSNVRFVFYNPNNLNNDFTLIHSDCRGEINNRQWQAFIYQRNNSFNIDQNQAIRHFGNWSNDLFNSPR
ncbi:MAG: GWxTD domain-containing protein [Bacteroidetes bacterium]|nr:GWxTD domain-containing protein [Bacteroidota bacterium]